MNKLLVNNILRSQVRAYNRKVDADILVLENYLIPKIKKEYIGKNIVFKDYLGGTAKMKVIKYSKKYSSWCMGVMIIGKALSGKYKNKIVSGFVVQSGVGVKKISRPVTAGPHAAFLKAFKEVW